MRAKTQGHAGVLLGGLTALVIRLIKSPIGQYSAVNSFAKLMLFIVTIVLASLMTPSQYGTVALVVIASSIVSSLTNFGFSVMVARESLLCSRQEFGELMSSSWLVSVTVLTLIIFVIVVFGHSFSWVGLEQGVLLCGVVLGFLLGRVDVFSKYFVAQQRISEFSILELCKGVVTALASLILVYVFLDHAVLARIAGLFGGAAVALVVSYYIFRKRVNCIRASKEKIYQILAYGTRVLPQAVANWIKLGADKIVIGSVLGLDVLGAYSFSFTVCSMFMVFGSALNNAFVGPCMSMYKGGDLDRIANVRARYIAIASALAIISFLSVILLSLIYWPEGYEISEIVIGLLMLSFWAQVIYLLYAQFFKFSLRMAELSYMNLLATLVYVFTLIIFATEKLEYVAICFCSYSVFMALYVMYRATSLERKQIQCISLR